MGDSLLMTLAVWRIRRNLGPPCGLAVDDQRLLCELSARGATWNEGDEWIGDEAALRRFAEGEVVAVRPASPSVTVTRRAAAVSSPECATVGSGAQVGPG